MPHVSAVRYPAPLAALLVLLLLLTGPGARAQAPAWQAAVFVGQGGGGSALVDATATNASGEIYLAGRVKNGPVLFGGTTLPVGVFLAKWSSTGNRLVWVQGVAETSGSMRIGALAVQGTSVYATGGFAAATVSFGSTTLYHQGVYGADIFIARLTDAGSSAAWSWAQRAGTNEDDQSNALAVSGTEVYLAGFTGLGPTNFGGLLLNAPHEAAFVAKLSDSGTPAFVWVQQDNGNGNDLVTALAVQGASVYVAGTFSGTRAAFGTTTLLNPAGGGFFNTDVFVAKLLDAGSSGSFVWAQRAGGSGIDDATALAVNGSSLYVAGNFQSPTADFGGITLANAAPTQTPDCFVAKLTDAGSSAGFSWAQQFGSMGGEETRALLVRGTSLYVAGSFDSPAVGFGPSVLTNTANRSPLFVAKLTDLGSSPGLVWAQQTSGAVAAVGTALAVAGPTLYVAGYAPGYGSSATLSFGSFGLASPSGFLASLTDPTLTATTAAPGSLPFTLAPNPARTATTVALPAQPGAATATLTLLDALGRTVRTATVALPPAGLRHELALGGLAPGLYALRVAAGAATATQRLVVE